MTKFELKQKTESVMNETKDALQTLYDELNQGQQKKIMKNKEIVELFERYKVEI